MTKRINVYPYISAVLLFTVLFFAGCSTKKDTFTRRFYHNLTAHYNTYWNGYESFNEGLRQLEADRSDNFTELLKVEDYGTLQQVQAINSHLDRASEKAAKVIRRHSMFFGRRERVRRVPDSYMLIGKVNFYKQDYYSARQIFEFVISRFEKSEVRYSSQLWLARTHIQLQEYEVAVNILNTLQNEAAAGTLPRQVVEYVPVVFAHHFVSQQNLQAAKPHLKRATETSNRRLRARMNFILAQIYQSEGNHSLATEHFRKVIDDRPSFEMDFNAKINIAQSFDLQHENSEEYIQSLNRLLRDSKYREFNDQIYFALATIALRENNDTLAIRYLQQSVAVSEGNDFQKIQSARKLAGLYFSIPDFVKAYNYYDTLMQILPLDHPDYETLEHKTDVLQDIAEQIIIIQHEDSLQMVARMPVSERNALIERIIEAQKAEIEQQELEARQEKEAGTASHMIQPGGGERGMPTPGRGSTPGAGDPTASAAWYFYNPQALSFGFTEFTKRWGRRKLADNWRLSDKRTYSWDIDQEKQETLPGDTIAMTEKESNEADPLGHETYLQNLPLTPELLASSNYRIASAKFMLGTLLREGLTDYQRAAETFEQYRQRFPGYNDELDVLFNLYGLHTMMQQLGKAAFYKDQVISKYPESEYAKMLNNPAYFDELQARKARVNALYQDAFHALHNGMHRIVPIYAAEAFSSFPDSELLPKFAYLNALAVGQIYNQDSLVNGLKQLISKFPSSDVVPLAQGLLTFLNIDGFEDESVATELQAEETSIYSLNNDASHLFVLIVNHRIANIDAIRIRISDFNMRNHRADNLSINSVLIDRDHQMITVGNFTGKVPAMVYFNAITASDYVYAPIRDIESWSFVITTENYPILYRDKDITEYMRFFARHYKE
ncbi:MAG TPA: tetratricopeptide repeat protein [Bacteroidales bacterium]|nr:tetratricopeptide repeat protein [Bacteroidales bacterium]